MEKKISKSNIKESAVKTVWARLKPFALWLGALLAIGCALLVFEADLLWKVQQHNVFLSSALFFKQQMVVPGGMLSYLGAFFTQHFYHPWVGVVLICGWWLLLMWLTQRTFSIPGRWIVVTLIPVAILLLANMSLGYWVYVIKLSGYFFVPTIGTTAALALIWAFRSLRLSPLTSHLSPLTSHLSPLTSHFSPLTSQSLFILFATLVGYPLMGVYALAAVALMGVLAWRRWQLGLVALLSVVSIPLLYYRFVYYETNLIDIYRTGLPVFSVSEDYPEYYIPYYALALCFLLLAIVCREKPQGKPSSLHTPPSTLHTPPSTLHTPHFSPLTSHLLQACVGVAVVGCVYHFWYKDDNFHHELRMQRCVEATDWEGVIAEGTKQDGEPTRAIVMMHNLALSRLGRLGDEMLRFPKGSKKPHTPLPVYMYHVAGRAMLYQYGLVNECHHVCMEEGVEYGWNVEVLKDMARCAIVNRETQAARKFLDLLRQTWYYGDWADHMEQLLGDEALLAKDREMGPVVRMLHYQDRLGSAEGYVERYVMTNLAQYDADDLFFQEQAVVAALWTRDASLFWPRFEHYVALKGESDIPRMFQEAAWLFANMEGQEGLDEWSLEDGVQESLFAFMKLMQQYRKSPNAFLKTQLYDQFGTTYYFEYFFLKDITYY